MVKVVAALIRENGSFLICQRPVNKTRALEWEFAGGKVEPNETGEQALIRECREELGVTVAVDDVYYELDHVYPDITIHLTLYRARIVEGKPRLLEHNDMKWITPEEIGRYRFCPADEEILKRIVSDSKTQEKSENKK